MRAIKPGLRAVRHKIASKLKSTSGETLVEVLVSTLIIGGVFAMLCTAIVAAAKVNTAIKPGDTVFNALDAKGTEITVTVSDTESGGGSALPRADASNESPANGTVTGYVQNGYVYYAYNYERE